MQKLFFFSYEVVSREEEEDKMRKKNMRGVRSVLIHFDSGHLLQMDRCPDDHRKGKGNWVGNFANSLFSRGSPNILSSQVLEENLNVWQNQNGSMP